jgi:hypothetical protein
MVSYIAFVFIIELLESFGSDPSSLGEHIRELQEHASNQLDGLD